MPYVPVREAFEQAAAAGLAIVIRPKSIRIAVSVGRRSVLCRLFVDFCFLSFIFDSLSFFFDPRKRLIGGQLSIGRLGRLSRECELFVSQKERPRFNYAFGMEVYPLPCSPRMWQRSPRRRRATPSGEVSAIAVR